MAAVMAAVTISVHVDAQLLPSSCTSEMRADISGCASYVVPGSLTNPQPDSDCCNGVNDLYYFAMTSPENMMDLCDCVDSLANSGFGDRVTEILASCNVSVDVCNS
ncbi:hypothetical protein M569_12331 [Genlisea aurea]|uniref:Bifunctional inhibitor/plant lipid transfer protein/seed storage helical domain-containing protein n=1 Tax=Genlisea aurea TaxID=192259 RepID=S8C6R5_9LAMI|nr:hypothetical protein M569_12331 [Genlisea aurea]